MIAVFALAIYVLYDKPSTRQETSEKSSYIMTIENDLTRLIDAYYDRHLSPHAYPSFSFVIPSDRSETVDRSVIHLMVTDPDTGRYFDLNTILQVGAHECAHVLCDVEEDDHHGPVFQEIMGRLDKIATELNLYDIKKPVPEIYERLCE